MKKFLLSLLVLMIAAGGASAVTINVPADQPTIEAAIAASFGGDVITIDNGTYNPVGQLNITTALTISGASEAGVTINIPTVGGYGFSVAASNVILENFTLVANATNTNFPIHASGTSLPLTGFDFLTLQNITIQGAHQRTGFDVHGYNSVTMSNLTSNDATGGNGAQITGCVDVTVDNITTANNAWGSFAIYSSKAIYMNRGSSNVNIDGASCVFGEGNLYNQDEFGLFNTGISVSGYGYIVKNDADAPGYDWFQVSEANAIAWALQTGPGSNNYIKPVAGGSLIVAPGLLIQPAIDAAVPGDVIAIAAGTYSEAVIVNKHVDLVGVGSGTNPAIDTILVGNAGIGPRILTMEASGNSAVDPILFQDMRLEPDSVTAIEIHNFQNVAFLKLDNVKIDGTNQTNDTESEIGLRVATEGNLTDLEIVNSAFDHLTYGWYFAKNTSAAGILTTVSDVSVTNTTFSNNDSKGIYVEKLENATFTGCTVSNNGIHTGFWNGAYNGGFDINLKYGAYANFTFTGCTFQDNGQFAKEGAGLLLKGRGTGALDAGYAANPATLDNVVIQDCVVTGNERGIRFGEPGKDNTTPTNVVVSDCTLFGNLQTYVGVDGSSYGDVVNQTTATTSAGVNWWGDNDPTDQTSGIGAVAVSPWYGLAPGTVPMAWGVNTSGTIQAAIDVAAAGDAISVAAGLYEEQLHIATDNLTISGAGVGATVVQAPDNMPLFFTTSADNYPIIFVDGATGTAIDNLTVDGLGRGATNTKFCGLGLHNANGSYSDMAVTGLRNAPLNGSQHGVGLYVINDDAGTRTVNFTNVAVSDIQKNATVFDGAGLSVYANNLDCTGSGPLGLGLPAQNGIQISGGTYAELTNCDIADYNYTESSYTATGLLAFGPGSVDMIGGTITACKTSVYAIDASGSIDGTVVTDPASDPLYAYSTGAKLAMKIAPKPFGEIKPAIRSDKSAMVFNIDNATFIGNDVVDSWGPTAYAIGPVDFNVTNTTIEHFDWGLVLYEDGGTVTGESHGNLLANNMSFGGWSNTVTPYDATMNDWGDLSGPFHPTLNLSGSGNEVSDNILFEPWTGMAVATIVPVTTGPVNCSQTITLTFSFTADDFTPDVFLYNAEVSATPGLIFGAVGDLLPFGTINDNFFAVATGSNQWTITGSTVGNPTYPVSGAGTTGLFTITFSATGDVVGNINFDSLILRDPDNNTIPVTFSGAAITYDCTAPAAVTAITAAPGHNKVDVAWVHDGIDFDHYEVFSGLWHDGANNSAYPEYDDLAGDVTPTPPANYLAATGAAPVWQPLSQVAVTSQTQTWGDHLSRGVYYYTVFAVDAAGNASAAPAAVDRATNYWLGDVATSGGNTPDGLVSVWDITALATAFGTSESGGGFYNNIIDVGPTDDWSRLGIPTTDSKINFEDLMMFSLNFGVVTSSKDKAPVSKIVDLAWVTYDNGDMALRLVNGSGLKGLNVRADRPVGSVEAGQLLDDQSELTFLKNVGTKLDVSVAVMGQNQAFEGSGDLFIVRSDSGIEVADLHITARATDNSELEFTMDTTSGTLTPRVFALNANYPNPFNPMTKISFSLPETQDVKLAVYSIDGRKVATLINEVRGPGLHEIVWSGQDDSGQTVASGMYFYRIDAGPYSQVNKMTLMK